MTAAKFRYVVITPARNEEAFLEVTIDSMLRQTVRPLRWFIVSDGSTDRTDEIVLRHAGKHTWITLLQRPPRPTRDFAGKAQSFNYGYERLKNLDYRFIASLDADLSFPSDYFEFLLRKFSEDPRLGLAGTPFSEEGKTYDYRFTSSDHVSGACQLFRRECFEQIGGYVPVRGGGIDVIAVLTARSKGWGTRTFVERVTVHHRKMGSANQQKKLIASFRFGEKSYRLGYHPVWQLFRTFYQMTRRPYVIGACADTLGYFWAMLRRVERPINRELIEFQQRDQLKRLARFLRLAKGSELAC
jgi:biofilm PGA synthesis N-glycosyltransferase PgaC